MGAFLNAVERVPFLHHAAAPFRRGMNPMMFKELSQGVRNKGFIGLFFLLLFSGLAIVVTVPLLAGTGQDNAPGRATFASLMFCLHVYGLAMGGRMLFLTFKEVENKTFDLYALSGMSPERMVTGKLMTTCYTYFFGLCCLAPFMFSSYFMRGLDFRIIFAAIAVDAILNVQYFAGCVLIGMSRAYAKHKFLLMALTVGLGIGMIIYAFVLFGFLLSPFALSDPFDLFALAGFDSEIFSVATFAATATHLLALVLAFYWSCHVVCPETDSREHMLKLLLFLLFIVATFLSQLVEHREGFMALTYILWYLFLGYGWFFWVNREDVPIIPRNHLERSAPWKRALLRLFEPGRRGSARGLVLMAIGSATIVMTYQFTELPDMAGLRNRASASSWTHLTQVDEKSIAMALGLPALGLFLLVAWDAALGMFRPLQRNYALRRSAILLTWGMIAVVAIFLIAIVFSRNTGLDQHPVTIVLGLFATPILTPWALDPVFNSNIGTYLTLTLGLAGLAIMYMDSRRIAADAIARRGDLGHDLYAAIGRGEVSAEGAVRLDAAGRRAGTPPPPPLAALAPTEAPRLVEESPAAPELDGLNAEPSESPAGGG